MNPLDPLVSVCLFTYMHEKYIEDCLKGLLTQSYSNVELFILDDASTDRTYEIILKYKKLLEKKFSRVEVEKNKINKGHITQNCNYLIKKTKGKYVQLFSGDDIMQQNCIAVMVKNMEKNEDKIMCYSNAYRVSESYSLQDGIRGQMSWYKHHVPNKQEDLFKKLLEGDYIAAPATMVRRRAYVEYGLYDEDIQLEDYEFWLRLSRKEDFLYIPSKLVFYRIAQTSITNFKTKDGTKKFAFLIKEEKKVYQKYLRFIAAEERHFYLERFYNKYLCMAIKSYLWFVVAQMFFFMNFHDYKIDYLRVKYSIRIMIKKKG